jgi:hypothetical protein
MRYATKHLLGTVLKNTESCCSTQLILFLYSVQTYDNTLQVLSRSRAGANAYYTQLLLFMSDGEDGGSEDEWKKYMQVESQCN